MSTKVGKLLLVAVSLLVFSAQRSDAKCDPVDDAADITAAQAAAATCDCNGFANHGQYVSCVADAVNGAALENRSCGGAVKKCAARSTCGKPGFVTCCRTKANGQTKCSTKSNADRCKAPKGGSACVGSLPSCCDACTDGGCAGSPSGAFLGNSD
jgi:hypothetical protein